MLCSSPAIRADEQYQKVKLSEQTTCPCCGSLPTTSMVHSFGGMAGQRYVACSLCGVQWHMPRIRCTRCLHEDHTSELQSRGHLVCRLLLEKKKLKVC